MNTYIDRMIEERDQLIERIKKLQDFINYSPLGDVALAMLAEQQDAMKMYLNVLCKRIFYAERD